MLLLRLLALYTLPIVWFLGSILLLDGPHTGFGIIGLLALLPLYLRVERTFGRLWQQFDPGS